VSTPSPSASSSTIISLLKYFNVALIGTDYGGGFHSNDRLVRDLRPNKVFKYQYVANP
jgi:hypothetical protein